MELDGSRRSRGSSTSGALPVWPTSVKQSDLRRWQATFDAILRIAEDPVLGRTILWLWEAAGGFGKCIFPSCLRQRWRPLIVQGSDTDIFYTVSQSIQNSQGVAPPIIIVDLPRRLDPLSPLDGALPEREL